MNRSRAASIIGVLVLWAICPVHSAAAAQPWWTQVALGGTPVNDVSADGTTIIVRTASGTTLRSDDGGATFAAIAGNAQLSPQNRVSSGNDTWAIDASGHILHAVGSAPARRDPASPDLGSGAHLIAAPAARPGVVAAVATDNTVWRRGQDGDWQRALLLLPRGFPNGVPTVTALTAFTQPLSDTVYMGTDGYSVLISTNGGDDWIRAGPGLPDSVLALTADAGSKSIYAGTSDGLWVHALQRLPSPTTYTDAALVWRWIGIAITTLVASVLAALALVRLLPPVTTRAP